MSILVECHGLKATARFGMPELLCLDKGSCWLHEYEDLETLSAHIVCSSQVRSSFLSYLPKGLLGGTTGTFMYRKEGPSFLYRYASCQWTGFVQEVAAGSFFRSSYFKMLQMVGTF